MLKFFLEFLRKFLNAIVFFLSYYNNYQILSDDNNNNKMNDKNTEAHNPNDDLATATAKESSVFGRINSDAYLQSLVYLELDDSLSTSLSLSRASTSSCGGATTIDYESSCGEEEAARLNEPFVKEKLRTLSEQVQSVYVLYGNRSMLVEVRGGQAVDQIAQSIVSCLSNQGVAVVRRALPYTMTPVRGRGGGDDNISMVLTCEMSDKQLAVVSSDKSEALKIIEAKTGLRLKKIKKTIYFAGVLFQFMLLNNLMTDRSREAVVANAINEKNKKETGKKVLVQ